MDEEILLPPPKRPELTPLSNADFRQFLDTPRRDAPGFKAAQQKGKGSSGAQGNQQKSKKPYRPKHKPEAEEKAEDDQAYRDRAEERRKGLNIDYDRANASAAGAEHVQLSVEDTKFLGGDVEHTHLVRGLDFALLHKVKEELVKPGAAPKEVKPKVVEKRQEPKFASARGRAIYNAVFNRPEQDVSEAFQPRRSAFVYELEAEVAATDLPTTLRRSVADCPPPVDTITATVDAPVLERLAKILGYMRVAGAGQPGKRLKRKDKLRMLEALEQQGRPEGAGGAAAPLAATGHANGNLKLPLPPTAAAKVEDDEDIFADAGTDYKLEAKPRHGTQQPDGSYFAQPDDMRELPPVRQGPADNNDMDLDEPDAPPPPPGLPPPPPPPSGPSVGPSLPPADYDRQAAYADMHRAAGQGYEAYVQANVAYQASQDPEYQALLAKQQEMQEEGGAGPHSAAPLPLANGDEALGSLTQQEREAGLASVFRREDGKQATRREADARERDPSYVSDAYAECYPSYHEYAPAIVDSDDEDLSHMDTKDKGQGRADFETEEQWQRYKSNKEAAPKAAFQFGVKVSDGRKGHKELGNKAKEQKFNNQLNQIQRKLEKDGGDYTAAFTPATLPQEEGRSGASKKRRI